MTESLMDFVVMQKQKIAHNDSDFHRPYWFKGHVIGFLNTDNTKFKLLRTSENFTTRTYPDHTQISRSIILDLLFNKHVVKVLIEIDKHIKFYTTTRTWFTYGKRDRLTPDQEEHLFLPIKYLHEVDQIVETH